MMAAHWEFSRFTQTHTVYLVHRHCICGRRWLTYERLPRGSNHLGDPSRFDAAVARANEAALATHERHWHPSVR